jgi:hypothetical protein
MKVATPHFAYPFAFNAKGEAIVVEQDGEADWRARAANVAVCPVGFREDLPEYGVPPLLFATIPIDVAGIREAISRWAELDASVEEHAEGLDQTVRAVIAEVSG